MGIPNRQPPEITGDRALTVLYLTWGEVIVQDGIFDNQVLEQLKLLRRTDPSLSLSLLSGMPLINRPLLKTRQSFYQDIERIRRELAAAQIDFAYRWIPAIARWFHSQPYHFPVYALGQLRYLRNVIRTKKIQVVHCRGYHAARLALLAKDRYRLTCSVIFDTRGLFPEEGVFAGHFTQDSAAYRFWKKQEKWLLDRADAVVNVSDTFTTHVQTLTSNPRLATIYTSANLELFQRNAIPGACDAASGVEARLAQRRALNIDDVTKVLVYSGSIGVDQGWHRVKNLAALFQAFQQAFDRTKLLIVTRGSHAALRTALDQIPGLSDQYLLVTGKSPQETASYSISR
ncbi:MAG: glycosyltransferase [Caldilineaceae bacterium]